MYIHGCEMRDLHRYGLLTYNIQQNQNKCSLSLVNVILCANQMLKAEISVITESQWWWLPSYQMSMQFKVSHWSVLSLPPISKSSSSHSVTFRRQTHLSLNFKYSIHPPQNIFNLPSRATSLNMSQSIITVTQIGPTFPFPLNW